MKRGYAYAELEHAKYLANSRGYKNEVGIFGDSKKLDFTGIKNEVGSSNKLLEIIRMSSISLDMQKVRLLLKWTYARSSSNLLRGIIFAIKGTARSGSVDQ